MSNQYEQLKKVTVCVADTGDIAAIEQFKPTDATTNPSLILKAVKMEQYASLLPDAVKFAKEEGKSDEERVNLAIDRLAVEFGARILKIVDGVVSTELDARLSFDVEASVARATRIIQMYEQLGVADAKDRVLIKVASTWEGMQICKRLKAQGIKCNMTLLFSIWQAAAAAEHGAFLISPFVGRITDWHKKAQGVDGFPAEEDPGVASVRGIYAYYKKFGYDTVVMGASFRSKEQVLALAGCDRLTIAPKWLTALEASQEAVPQKLFADKFEYLAQASKLEPTEANFRWGMCQDACATEKLAEGIRKFSADIDTLQQMVVDQMAK